MIDNEMIVDQSLINDFFSEYEDAQDEINSVIDIMIDSADTHPDDYLMDTIRRRVHSIKSNFRMIGETRQSSIIHYLETILTFVKQSNVEGKRLLLLLLRIILEEVRFITMRKLAQDNVSHILEQLETDMQVLSGLPESDLHKNIREFLLTMELQGDYDAHFSLDFINELAESEVTENNLLENAEHLKLKLQLEIEQIVCGNNDLIFFKELIEQLEMFIPFWKDRSKKILGLLMAMNRARDCLVDEEQLIAAVYMHDIGMGFIAPFITHKPYSLDPDEEIIMQDHIHQGAGILRRMSGWESAAEMISAHHENMNGSGYPLGLNGDAICDGAKLLAIGDAFWAMTNDRMYVYKKKPVINALMDLGRKSGIIYDEHWVEIFNQVLKES